MTVAKSLHHDVVSTLSLPTTVHPEHVLHALPDNWIVRDQVDIGYLSDNYLLISSYGVFALFPQHLSGEVVVGERQFSVDHQNQAPLLQAIQEAIRKYERQLGIRVHPVVLYRELHESMRPGELHLQGRTSWQVGQVKIISWAGLKPFLQSQVYWQLSWAEIQQIYRRSKDIRQQTMG